MNNRTISVYILSFAALVVIIGCFINSTGLALAGLLLSIVGVLCVMINFYEAPDTRGRMWGESVFNAAGRQISSGSCGFHIVFAVIFGFLALACLFSGQVFGFAILAFMSMTAANS